MCRSLRTHVACWLAAGALLVLGGRVASAPAAPAPTIFVNEEWAQPPRGLLPLTVSARVNGTVADALRALLEGQKLQWLVGAPPEGFGALQEFEVSSLPLHEALDRLLETYGYDWGVNWGVIVAWPALQPPRPREQPAPLQWPLRTLVEDETAIIHDQPTPVAEALAATVPTIMCAPDDDIGAWVVMGRANHVGSGYISALPLAVCGTISDTVGLCGILRSSNARRLSQAWSLLSGAEPGAAAEMDREAARAVLLRAAAARLTAQQWSLLREGQVAVELPLRELSVEGAAAFVSLARRGVGPGAGDRVDWARPGALKVVVAHERSHVLGQDGTVKALPERLQATCVVPQRNGPLLVF